MNLSIVNRTTIAPALALLPARMNSKQALVIMYAIGLQESKFTARRQMGNGPARGLWQFERDGGTAGVLRHAASRPHALKICKSRGLTDLKEVELTKGHTPTSLIKRAYDAFEHDDVLAAAFARLLLWTDARALPAIGDSNGAFKLYIRTWNPGAYSRGTAQERSDLQAKFNGYYAQAVSEVGSQ